MGKKVLLSIIISALFFALPIFAEDDFLVGETNLYIGESYDLKDIVAKFIKEDFSNLSINKDPLNYYFEIENGRIIPKFVGEGLLIIYKDDEPNYVKFIKLHSRSKIKAIDVYSKTVVGNSGDIVDLPIDISLYDDVKESSISDLRVFAANYEIVSVLDDFKLKLKAAGTTTLTISTIDGSVKETLNVTSKGNTKSLKITNKDEYKKILVGQSAKFDALHNGMDNPELVTWSSSNSSVVSVDDDGYIKGLSVGESLVSATSLDDRIKDVTLVNVYSNIAGISVDEDSVVLREVGETHKINPRITYRDKSIMSIIDGYYFVSDHPEVAKVSSDGNIEALSPGLARISVRAKDGLAVAYVDVYVNLSEEVDPLEPIVQIKTLRILDRPDNVLVGEKIPLYIDYEPSNATRTDLDYRVSDSDIGKVSKEGDIYYYTPRKTGMNQILIEAPSGARTSLNISARSYLGSIRFNVSGLEKASSSEYRMYVGQSLELLYDFIPRTNSRYETVYNTGVEYLLVDSNLYVDKQNDTLKAVREGDGKVRVRSIDGNYTDTLYLNVETAYKSLKTNLSEIYRVGDRVKVDPIVAYKANAPKDLKINTRLSIHKQFLDKSYVENEIRYEKNLLAYLKKNRSISENIRLSLISISEERLKTLEDLLEKSSGEFCELTSYNRLRDRQGNFVKIASIDGDEITFVTQGKVSIVTSEVGSRLHYIDEIVVK